MTSNTSAYLSSRAEMSGTITAWVAPVIGACGEENEAMLGEAIGNEDPVDAPGDESDHDSNIEDETNSEDAQTGTPNSKNEDDAVSEDDTTSEEESQIETPGEDSESDVVSGGETPEPPEPASYITPDDGAIESGGDQIDTSLDVPESDLVEVDTTEVDCDDLIDKSDEVDPESSNDIISDCGDEDVEGKEEQEIVEVLEEQETGEDNVDCGNIDEDSEEGTEMVEVIEDEKATDPESEDLSELDGIKDDEDLDVNKEEEQESPEDDIQTQPDKNDESIKETEQVPSIENKEAEEISTLDDQE